MLTAYEMELALRLRPQGFEYIRFDDETFTKAFLSCFGHDAPATVILGPGGAGKSEILKMVAAFYGANCLLLAPTGVAANNIDNPWSKPRTIHAGLGLPVMPIIPENRLFTRALEALHDRDVVMVDEISMVNAPLLDVIIRHIEEANKSRRRRIKLICFGDEYQLQPPFDEDKLLPILHRYPNLCERWTFLNSKGLMAMKPDVFILNAVYRQHNQRFKEVLGHVRIGMPDTSDIKYLNNLVADEPDRKALVLASTNKEVDDVNNMHLANLEGKQKPMVYDAEFIMGSRITDCGFSSHLELFKGQRVMCTRNLYDENGTPIFQNGTLGTVVDFHYQNGEILPVVRADDGRLFTVPFMQFEECAYIKNNDGKYDYLPVAKAMMLPLKAAYCITYHKAQGLTLDKVHLMIPDRRPQPGQMYLGCSRVRTPEGLSLSSKVTPEMFSLSKEKTKDGTLHIR